MAGVDEAKEAVAEVVDLLRDPSKYARMGARVPRGVLLVGPPGTGKTLLAKCVAAEAGVPFFYCSGSHFKLPNNPVLSHLNFTQASVLLKQQIQMLALKIMIVCQTTAQQTFVVLVVVCYPQKEQLAPKIMIVCQTNAKQTSVLLNAFVYFDFLNRWLE